MRLVSWNVNGRTQDACRKQGTALLGRAPDVVALQEVAVGSYRSWCDLLLGHGLSIVSTIDLVDLPYPPVDPPIRRKYFNLIGARHPIARLRGLAFEDPAQARHAFPEKYVAARVLIDGASVEIHNAHLPPGSTRGVIKLDAFEAIRRRTDEAAGPLLLCGDFNTPQYEDTSGVTTWASSHGGLYERWDAAERLVLQNPRLRDVYRDQHDPATAFPTSHLTGTTGRRYDHIYASAELRATACTYHVDWLGRLSDHAAVEADFSLGS